MSLKFFMSAVLCSAALAFTGALAQEPNTPRLPDGVQQHETDVGEVRRSYTLFVPEGLQEPAPLLLLLHGRGGNGAGMMQVSGFNEIAQEVGLLVAYPDGLDAQWNYLTGIGGNAGVDDLGFLLQLVREVAERYQVDSQRVFLAGYSNGGFMTQRAACEADSPFAAYASVGATGFGGMPTVCSRPRPVSVLFIHGTADPIVPWSGQVAELQGRELLISASVPQTLAFWANHAGCSGAADRSSRPLSGSAATAVEILAVSSCPEGNSVVLQALLSGGHEWPRFGTGAGADGGGFDAARVIWEFFERATEFSAPAQSP